MNKTVMEISNFFQRMLYSIFFVARKNRALSYFWLDMLYIIGAISIISTIQAMSLLSVASLFVAIFGGRPLVPDAAWYYGFLGFMIFIFWVGLGGEGGFKRLVDRYDSNPDINGELIFKITFGRYVFVTLIFFVLGMICEFYIGQIVRGR